jgi:hypothetical protein
MSKNTVPQGLQGWINQLNTLNAAAAIEVPDALLQRCCAFEQLEFGQVPTFGTAPRLVYPSIVSLSSTTDIEPEDTVETAKSVSWHNMIETLHSMFGHVLKTAAAEMKQTTKPLTVQTVKELREQYPEYNAVLVSAPFYRDLLAADPTEALHSVYCPVTMHEAFSQGCLGTLVHPDLPNDSGIEIFSDMLCWENLRFVPLGTAYLYKRTSAHYFRVGGPSIEVSASAVKTALDIALAIETDGFIRWNWKQ